MKNLENPKSTAQANTRAYIVEGVSPPQTPMFINIVQTVVGSQLARKGKRQAKQAP